MNRLNHQLKQIHTSIVGLTGNGLTEEKLINLINMNSSADSRELITENSGVAIYTNNNLGKGISSVDIAKNQIELDRNTQLLKIKFENTEMYVVGMYRPPHYQNLDWPS